MNADSCAKDRWTQKRQQKKQGEESARILVFKGVKVPKTDLDAFKVFNILRV